MTTKELPLKCPSCGKEMRVCLIKCPACETEVQGDFEPGRFAGLTEDQMNFMDLFVRCRGNLKDIGGMLGISYPTARNRLDDLIRAMDNHDRQKAALKRMEILQMVRDGSITVDEAVEYL
jgi:hypothetical protein